MIVSYPSVTFPIGAVLAARHSHGCPPPLRPEPQDRYAPVLPPRLTWDERGLQFVGAVSMLVGPVPIIILQAQGAIDPWRGLAGMVICGLLGYFFRWASHGAAIVNGFHVVQALHVSIGKVRDDLLPLYNLPYEEISRHSQAAPLLRRYDGFMEEMEERVKDMGETALCIRSWPPFRIGRWLPHFPERIVQVERWFREDKEEFFRLRRRLG